MLDVWVKGSVLFNGAVYLEDTLNRRQSRWLSLDGAAKGDAKVLAGPTDDGWYHVQVRGWQGKRDLVGGGCREFMELQGTCLGLASHRPFLLPATCCRSTL